MGIFSNRVPKLSDRRLRDFNYLLNPIEQLLRHSRQWTSDRNEIAVTVANRLAHLTNRMERTPTDETCESARWYLDNLKDITIVPAAREIIDPLITRLRRAIDEYVTHTGRQCIPWRFSRLVGPSAEERFRVLYGPPFWTSLHDIGGAAGPREPLSEWISFSCWKQATLGRY